MRVVVLLAALAIGSIAGSLMLGAGKPSVPASERLAGVHVRVQGIRVAAVAGANSHLLLGLVIDSTRNVDECLAFALDEPFNQRVFRVSDPADGCVRPIAGQLKATIVFDNLTGSDRAFTSHSLVWGVRGGGCGLMGLFGMCAVDFAGTVDVNLPQDPRLPTIPPMGTFKPFPTYRLP